MHRPQPGKFACEGSMIGLPPLLTTPGDFGLIGRAIGVEQLAPEGLGRHQAGGGHAGIQARAVGRSIEVDDIPRLRGHQQRGTHLAHEIVDQRQMPVGVGQRQGRRVDPGDQIGRQAGADMRHRHHQGGVAAKEIEGRVADISSGNSGLLRHRRLRSVGGG